MLKERLAVPPERLCRECQATEFPFSTTAEIRPLEGLIGQERAVAALEFGLGVRHPGYNVFVAGLPGTGKSSYTRSVVQARAAREPEADDWCYAFNFRQPDRPIALRLPPGRGPEFAADVDELIRDLRRSIARAFASSEYDRERGALLREAHARIETLIAGVEQEASRAGFALRSTPMGFAVLPLRLGQPMTPEELESLDSDQRSAIQERSAEIQARVREALRAVWSTEKEAQRRVGELDRRVAEIVIDPPIERLRRKYADVPRVGEWLAAAGEDVLNRIELFRAADDSADGPAAEEAAATRPERGDAMVEGPARRGGDPFRRYRINVLVTREGDGGAPVVIESNPTFYNLFGKVEYAGQFGEVATDHLLIRAGAIHRANGGYLVVQALDVLQNPGAWDGLKRVLSNKEATIEAFGEQFRIIHTATLRPEPIPLQVKVIMLGSPALHQALYHTDEAFRKLFKIKADFEVDMARTQATLESYAGFIANICRRDGLLPFEPAAVARVIDYSSRLAEDQEKVSTRFNEVTEVIYESDAWAARAGARAVARRHVDQAIEAKVRRSSQAEDRVQEMLLRGHLMVATEGTVVGQVNGLSVYDTGDLVFGRPSRITACVFMGERGVVNIEREVEMSGKIHSKGVLILSGYLGAMYAQDKPLTLSATLTFEQLYGGVDGDSASSAELYALLSALAEAPIDQGIAVTGSVNQRGEIQPVGGTVHKIEGFFDLCAARGLNGRQGVIIPHQNVANLMLKPAVVEAVRAGKFHVWAVRTVDEGIELLTGMPAGERLADGSFTPGSVHDRVNRRLEKFARDYASLFRPRSAC